MFPAFCFNFPTADNVITGSGLVLMTSRDGDNRHQVPAERTHNTMQLTCKVNQPEAIKRGFNTNSTIKLDVDVSTLTETQRTTLAAHFVGGDFRQEHPQYPQHRHWDFWPEIPQPDLAGLLEKLDHLAAAAAAMAAAAAEKAKQEQAAAAAAEKARADYLNTPDLELIEFILAGKPAMEHLGIDADGDVCSLSNATGHWMPLKALAPDTRLALKPETRLANLQAKSEAVLALARAHNLAVYRPAITAFQAQAEAKAQAAQAEAKAAAKAKADNLAYAVATYGTDLQKQMHQRGVLDEAVLLQWLEDEAFAAVKLPIYVPLDKDDCTFPDDVDPEYLKLYHRQEDVEALTESQFAAQLQVEAALPGCTCQVQMHVIEDDNDSKVKFTERRYALKVTVTHRGLEFTRFFAV